jgi:hypothetical protein
VIELDGGVVIPMPPKRNPKGFTKPEGETDYRWRRDRKERWHRAYMHCLYSLPLHFHLPLHNVVPNLAKSMLEATSGFNIALRFMGEMELQGYVELKRGYSQRVVVPTRKFQKLVLDCTRAPESVIKMPKNRRSELTRSPIRNGISSPNNKSLVRSLEVMTKERFEINSYVYDLLLSFPPKFKEKGSEYMFGRTMACAKMWKGKTFYFPWFWDSRSRMYTDTTCGFTPQGADHEKAVVIPTHKEILSDDGYKALVETAVGYSEIEWSVEDMVAMAREPAKYEEVWKEADKPFSFMACANMLHLYDLDPSTPLPAFIPLDGRCSGLQHWSAVTRSNAITRHLGMHVEEDPLDIYEKVAEDWKKKLDPEWQFMAVRKTAKIPVMTWGYNATVMTSMDWVNKLYGAEKMWCPDIHEYVTVGEGLERKVAGKLGADLYSNLNETLSPLKAAVDWVSECAVKISSVGNVDITWPTPDGFLAVQRKVKGEKKDLNCTLSDGSRLALDILNFDTETPNTAKHRSAIAPNIIHGLDATHLRMVAKMLEQLGLPMVFIHDSFATHVNHRAELYTIIVDTFIDLYSGNYLQDLCDFWSSKYSVKLEVPPHFGSWKPEQLQGLTRFFV